MRVPDRAGYQGPTRRPGLAVASKTTSTGCLAAFTAGACTSSPFSLSPLSPASPLPPRSTRPCCRCSSPDTARCTSNGASPFASLEISDSKTRQRHLAARTNDPERLHRNIKVPDWPVGPKAASDVARVRMVYRDDDCGADSDRPGDGLAAPDPPAAAVPRWATALGGRGARVVRPLDGLRGRQRTHTQPASG